MSKELIFLGNSVNYFNISCVKLNLNLQNSNISKFKQLLCVPLATASGFWLEEIHNNNFSLGHGKTVKATMNIGVLWPENDEIDVPTQKKSYLLCFLVLPLGRATQVLYLGDFHLNPTWINSFLYWISDFPLKSCSETFWSLSIPEKAKWIELDSWITGIGQLK